MASADRIANWIARPQFAAFHAHYDDAGVADRLDEADAAYSSQNIADWYAAHLLAIDLEELSAGVAGTDGGSGVTVEQEIGELRVEYSRPDSAGLPEDREHFLGRTPYGRRVMRLERLGAPIFWVADA